ncbi:hypothetical protein [Haloechinothrix salitolerans]|uniref:Uncharacterized protein n=1 Tax=Haloechinothrix salitolerans TaxID=926830 RepID=A0ABW2C196_9PSEU
MRDVYQHDIAEFAARLDDLAEMARWEMRKATCALFEEDLTLARADRMAQRGLLGARRYSTAASG